MVQTTQARHSHHGGIRFRPLLDGPLVRGVFGERVVHPVLLVQVINTIPILLKSEKSCIRGIRGAVAK